ncbi:MAG TPA: FG-GAP-like repeat-containing protein [Candidatus Dormibacteraeota bacterium]|nr:FG-GAP-like repeat-containing protein [Candidatus Dormibacteraeota bacterium]
MRAGVLGALLAGSFAVAGSAPVVVSAATAVVGTSTHVMAFQHSAADKVAYLHDGSLLVGFFDGTNVVIQHVTNPVTAPVSSLADTISGGSEVTLYTLPGAGTTDIWIAVGSELTGGTKQEQIQHGIYTGSTFSPWDTLTTIPGSLTGGRQDPSVTWTGKWLIVSWWDDTTGGNSDNVFYNWTTDKTGTTGWHVPAKSGTTATLAAIKSGTTNAPTIATATSITYATSGAAPVNGDLFEFGSGTVNSEIRAVTVTGTVSPFTLTVAALSHPHAMGEVDTTAASLVGATSVIYNLTSGPAPAVGDGFQIGTAVSNNGTVTCGTISTPGCDAEYRLVTAVSGGGPYTLSVAALSNSHAIGEPIRIAASLLTTTGGNIAQVSIRHSTKLGATIAVYGARNHVYTRTLLDSKADPSPANWTTESLIDAGFDDSEWGFGGPQIAIDETTGKIHVFRALTNHGGPTWTGVTYWLGTPDAAPMVSGAVTWNSRLVIDAAAGATDPPDIAGAVDSTGKVYVFWTTTAIAGAIKYVTLVTPFTAFTPAVTVATTGANPRYPHVPDQAPLTGGFVPLVYQSGSGPYSINLDVIGDTTPPSVPTGLSATANSGPQVTLTWNASTDNVGVTGYTIYRDGTAIATVGGSTLTYTDNSVGRSTYSYAVDAFDAAGNHSAKSAAVVVSTTAGIVISGKPLAGDFNGDGKADVALVTTTGVSVTVSNGSAFTTPSTWAPFPFYGTVATLAGDVTGDGKADLVAVNAGQTFVLPSTGTGFGALSAWSNVAFYGTRGTFLADVNGDGKADLVAVNNTSVWVMLSTGSGFSAPTLWSSTPFYGNLSTQIGDVSGDGKADLVAINSTSVWVMTSTGSGFGAPAQWSGTPFYGTIQTMLVDANGDGKVDLVALNNTSTWIITSTGTGFGPPTQWSNTPFYGTLGTLAGDVDGDHKVDLIAINNTSIWVARSTGTAMTAPELWL